jgi:uncharacterized protein (DUF2062 family)
MLRWLGPLLDRPWLWAVNRNSVSRGLAIGLFFGFLLPIGQALAAGALAVWVRANLPIAVASTFVSNPFTTPPIVAGAYYLGATMLGVEPGGFADAGLTLLERAYALGGALAVGLVILATVASTAGFILVQGAWRIAPLIRLMRRRRAIERA